MSGMSNAVLEFGGFRLEPGERRLTRGGAVMDISGRYLDALHLLASAPGELVTKDRFMAEVWRGIPVTDEALTQCIRSLRKALGDEAGKPRFIETVPRYGYRFIAEVRVERSATATAGYYRSAETPLISREQENVPEAPYLKGDSSFKLMTARSSLLLMAATGLAGGAAAGLIGGICYGLIAATEPPPGAGAISILLVMTCVCLLIGMIGGLAVASGSALGRLLSPCRLFPVMAGGAAGGMVVGALGRLIGLDAFSLLVGSRPLATTGGSEGLLIGAIAGAGLWLAERDPRGSPAMLAAKGGLLGAGAGLLVTLGGGKMMAGSLAGLAAVHPDAPLGHLLSELSPALLLATGAMEGAIFIAALTLAFGLVLRSQPKG